MQDWWLVFFVQCRYSENILTPNRQVRTRLYFTSESHIHSLVNIIRYGGLFPDPDKEWAAADKYLSTVTELNYLSHLVFLLYEDPTKGLQSVFIGRFSFIPAVDRGGDSWWFRVRPTFLKNS